MIEKEFVPYQESLKLKELGFNRECLGQFNIHQGDKWLFSIDLSGEGQYPSNSNACLAPTFSQAFRWFREKHELEGDISHLNDGKFKWSYQIKNITNNPELSKIISSQPYFESYEEAELACLNKLIEIVKQ